MTIRYWQKLFVHICYTVRDMLKQAKSNEFCLFRLKDQNLSCCDATWNISGQSLKAPVPLIGSRREKSSEDR